MSSAGGTPQPANHRKKHQVDPTGLKSEPRTPCPRVVVTTEVGFRALLIGLISGQATLGPRATSLLCAGLCALLAAFSSAGFRKDVSTLRQRARRGTVLLLLFSFLSTAIRRRISFSLAAAPKQRLEAVGPKAITTDAVQAGTQTLLVQTVDAQTQTLETLETLDAQTQTQDTHSSPKVQPQTQRNSQMPHDPQSSAQRPEASKPREMQQSQNAAARRRTTSRAHRRQMATAARVEAGGATENLSTQ